MIAVRPLFVVLALAGSAWAQGAGVVPAPTPSAAPRADRGAVEYRVILASPERRMMEVKMTVGGLPAAPLQLHMSRTSPGRYALHEFTKNVFDVRIRNGKGQTLQPDQTRIWTHFSNRWRR